MDLQFRLASADAVRSRIARAVLGTSASSVRVGSVELQPHQLSAVNRLGEAIDSFRGALLCDEVGMGKTYVALAVAARFGRCAIVAPAALFSMWRDALSATGLPAELVSFESLSRVRRVRRSRDNGDRLEIVIIDEAHHARNPATNRYFALSSLVRGARVLLLTATPIHNRRKDLVALLSLFLGTRSERLTEAELSLCVIRREQRQVEGPSRIPAIAGPVVHAVPDTPGLVERLLTLPPPIPVRGGGIGGALIGRSLVHQWASSEAAFREALKRRIARATALCASLECGRYPSAAELETWVYGDGALQLGFTELLAPSISDHGQLLASVRAHLQALNEIRSESTVSGVDDHRATIVPEIVATHRGSAIVAFAQYSETVSMLFRRLSRSVRVALLTSHGARVAGGALGRDEAIHRFAPVANHRPAPSAAEKIDLLLTTDLLSEGVNLQDASVVIHLDIPWTVARMEQRVGRVARIGSRHSQVHVHLLRPPASAAATLETDEILDRKWRIATTAVGTTAPNPGAPPARLEPRESVSAKTELLRSILARWLSTHSDDGSDAANSNQPNGCLLSAIAAPQSGFIAAVQFAQEARVLVSANEVVSVDLDDQLRVCQISGVEIATEPTMAESALVAIEKWCVAQSASSA
ncbi:MAG TPA: helicase-related protein, partial [Gemmatimonadaceae bacterium]|nr:helicase-related protein [Gemmatimonadaceae bacterium]